MSTVDNKMNISMRSPLEARRDCLDSWKEIAVYLRREVRTVQRWEKREGLPVHRQFHTKAGTVCAFKHEIDAWFENRCRVVNKPAPQSQPSDQAVDWSSPTLHVARQTGKGCWLCLVFVRDSHRFDSHSAVLAMDRKVDGRETLTINQNPSARLACDNS
jgi:hypothetical protein